ncbi:MAG: cobalamin-binding protein [Bacteroidetes bacterium GWC2_33_15]|nr:MAG: cobalamin-binding protein [Bacteroidetes bacterium GWA2_33_15]OFX52290.1 MAG: cobalamin-binding protein [Bacteroidetes bacterium GWC2_33_15]OFX64444.1 MAG: cobalamin-binding protein [Bacteroidetes bacterium GWB2_32_14]OFX67849.1 MAG: cobalamin-binding protein [Bacteroidetes bacterium GWD2_33_33]HAN19467.1 cobalamin-binding protein [Bacteroidales bacterium]
MHENKAYTNYLNALINGDKDFCTLFIQNKIEQGADVKTIYVDYFQESLYEIGKLWENNKISVATEHLATSITERLMLILYPQIFSESKNGKNVIIACVANELHQVGAKMVADIFELNQWNSYFIGSNTPVNDLIKFVDEKKPDMVGLSLSIYFNINYLVQAINILQDNFKNIELIVGGQAFKHGGEQAISRLKHVNYIDSLYALEKMIS